MDNYASSCLSSFALHYSPTKSTAHPHPRCIFPRDYLSFPSSFPLGRLIAATGLVPVQLLLGSHSDPQTFVEHLLPTRYCTRDIFPSLQSTGCRRGRKRSNEATVTAQMLGGVRNATQTGARVPVRGSVPSDLLG